MVEKPANQPQSLILSPDTANLPADKFLRAAGKPVVSPDKSIVPADFVILSVGKGIMFPDKTILSVGKMTVPTDIRCLSSSYALMSADK